MLGGLQVGSKIKILLEAEMDADGLLTSLEGPRDGCASI